MELSPLVPKYLNSFSEAIKTYAIERNPLYKTTKRKVVLVAGTIFCVGLGLVGRYPFIAPAVEFANKNKVLKILYGYSALVGLGSLSAWALIGLFIDGTMPNLVNQNQDKNCCNRVANQIYTLSLALIGISAQLSIAYMGYYYNSAGLFWAILILVADSGLPAYSVHLFIKEIASKNVYLAKCIGINTGENYLQLGKQKKEILSKLNFLKNQVIEYSNDLTQLNMVELEEKGIESKVLMTKIMSLNPPKTPSANKRCCSTRNPELLFSYIPGIVFPIIGFVFRGKLSYEGAKLIWDNAGFKWFIVGISTLPMSYLTFNVTIETSRSLYKNTINFFMRKKIKTYANAFYPKTLMVLKALGIGTAAFTFASIAKVSQDFFGTGFIGWTITIGSSANLTAMVVNSQLDFIDWITIPIIKRFGNKQARKVGEIIDKINIITKINEEANEESMEAMIKNIDLKI